ncbi:S8 family serine peptidase [Kitasatospora sp. NPDC057692]|uniref:S8 family serine peptidase n=1 Tax=Kitasatospora sp. NPDC057692 TaxID=3346215 RepID=UPI0036C4EBBF
MTVWRRIVHAGGAFGVAVSAVLLGSSAGHADSIRAGEWPLDSGHFRAEEVWAVSRGSGAVVAVVDSGVAAGHPDLEGRILPGVSLVGEGGDGRTDTSGDSHGTAVAGIIAATGGSGGTGMTGLAPDANVLPVRVGGGGQIPASLVARGIVWAADHGAQVVNVSVGSPDPDPLLKQAVTYALGKDVIVVASAGNDGDRGNPAMYPAAFPGVVSVSGVDETGAFWLPSESGRGITIAAPATGIYSTNDQGGYVQADGTSYAAAYVSATAALIRSHQPNLSAGQVIHRLISTTVERHKRPDAQFGYGRLDPLAALTVVNDPEERDNPLLRPMAEEPSESGFPVLPAGAVAVSVLAAGATGIAWRRRHRAAGGTLGKSASATVVVGRPGQRGDRPRKAPGGRRR